MGPVRHSFNKNTKPVHKSYQQIAFLVQRTTLFDGPLLFAAAVQPQSQQTFARAAHCVLVRLCVWYVCVCEGCVYT